MKQLTLTPVEMTPELMQDLEDRKLIIRLCPNHHELPVQNGEAASEDIYAEDSCFGGHKLITVTVNRFSFSAFGSHPANEEFLMIGDSSTKPLYLAVCKLMKDKLAHKISEQTLTADDFICLKIKYNDPQVSFFTMLANVPHGEAAADTEDRAPSFYVTEPSDMGIEFTDFGDYELAVEGR